VVVAYLLSGFYLAPVVVKWQVEKQVREKLGHTITPGKLRINPLKLTAEANDVELRSATGGALIAFSRLFVDFEARSIIDRAWTFAAVTLEQPAVHIESDKEGRLNFLPLIEALRGTEQEEGPLPRLLVQRLTMRGGRIEFTDRQLAEPLVTRATPVEIEFTDLSTLPTSASPYRLSARTAAGESMSWSGVLRLNPFAADGRLALEGLQTATLARVLRKQLAVGAPAGRIDFSVEHRLSYDTGALSGSVDRLEVNASGFSVTAPGAQSVQLALDAVALTGARVDLGKRTIAVPRLALGKGTVVVRLDGQGAPGLREVPEDRAGAVAHAPASATKGDAREAPWNVAFQSVQVTDVAVSVLGHASGRAAVIESARASLSGEATLGAGGARIALKGTKLALSRSKWASEDEGIVLPAAEFESAALSFVASGTRSEIRIERPRWQFDKISIRQGEYGMEAESYSFEGKRITAVSSPDKMQIGMDAPKVTARDAVLEQDGGRVDLRKAGFEGSQVSIEHGGGAPRIAGDGVRITLAGFAVRTKDGRSDFLSVGDARSHAKSLVLSFPGDGTAIVGEGLSAELSGVVLRDPRDAQELARVGRAQMAGGSLRSHERIISANSVLLADGGARVALDARGGLNWAGLARGADASSGADDGSAASRSPAWRVAAKAVELKNFGVAFTDARHDPPAAIALHGIQATLDDIDTGAKGAANLDLRAKVRQGGDIAVSGKLDPRTGRSDLKLKIAALALAPAQPFLSALAELQFASGTLSTEGRMRYGDPAAGATIVYEGSAAVDQLLIEEAKPRRPFLAQDSVAAAELTLTVGPNRLDISELRVNAPEGRLVIADDQSANVSRSLEKTPKTGSPEKRTAPARGGDPFPVSVARVRVERGVLEFADYSLRPQFRTRMHELKGVVTGFGTSPGRRAKLQLDARVDQYGLARIEGEIVPLSPQDYTDVGMTFRNLEMTALTPYVEKFAGYRIAGGKLSLDLRYRIKDGLLVGENHIVLNKLELGEKVESPDALDFSLELAVALLKDANGVIDVQLPVTGNLQDPQFDYGEIIGKAMGNLIGSIVTAPFRVLGVVFGGGSEDLGSIEFEPGTAVLTPPEREKLEAVARALKSRPQLRLLVGPAFAPKEDLAALKSAAVRHEILARIGIKPAPGEEPGPVDIANERTQRAIEAIFAQRYSSTLLERLKRRPEDTGDGEAQAGGDADPASGGLHRVLLDRLVREQPVGESALRELAARRAAAIVQELTSVAGVERARGSLGEARAATEPNGESVSIQLDLGAAR